MVDSESDMVGVGFSLFGWAPPTKWYTASEEETGCKGNNEGWSRFETAEADMTLGSRHTEVVCEATNAIEIKESLFWRPYG
jgi:hypothetical protein